MAALTRFTVEQQKLIASEWLKPGRPLLESATAMLATALKLHQENLAAAGGTLSPEQLESAGLHFMRLGPVAILWATVKDHMSAMGARVEELTQALKASRSEAQALQHEVEQLRARCAHLEASQPLAVGTPALTGTWGLG